MAARFFYRLFFGREPQPSIMPKAQVPKGLTDKPWLKEDVDFSKSYEQMLKKNMDRQFNARQVNGTDITRANILLVGPVKAGKSSFFNSVASVCKGRVVKLVKAGETGESMTVLHGKYKPDEGSMQNFCLMDCIGIQLKGGLHLDDVCNLVNGHVPKNYKFNPISPLTKTDPQYNHEPKESDKVHCVVFVIDAESIYADMPEAARERIYELKTRLDPFEFQQVVVLTKIDRLCTKVYEDVANVFKSVKVQQTVKKASEFFQLAPNQIFPVKNYFDETTYDFKLNIPILLALRTMVNYAEDFLENQKD